MSRTLVVGSIALVVVACKGPEPEPEPEVDPPSAPVVGITPATPHTGDDLVAEILDDSVDPQDLAVNYTYSWSDGGSGGQDGATLPSGRTARGQTWTVTVTPDNGEVDGPPGTASATIANSVPTVAGATLGPDPAYTNDDLTCTPGATVDADGDTVTLHYAWTVAGDTAGTDAATLSSSEFERFEEVVCTATPDDGTDSGAPATSNAVTIGNRPPSVTTVTVVPQTGSTATSSIPLVCSPNGFADPDGDGPVYHYAWTVNSGSAGLDAPVLSDSSFTKGSTVVCTVTPSDGAVDGAAVASDPVTIQNSPPVLASATISPSTAYTNTELDCDHPAAVDPDGEPAQNISYFYQWTVNGSVVGGNTASLTNTDLFARDQSVVCTVTPLDLDDAGLPVPSDPLVISNTLPATTSVQIDQTTAYTNTDLTCSAEGDDLDDADTVTFDYEWKVNGAVKGGNSSTLSSSEFVKGQNVICTATAKDPAVGSGLPSASLQISDSPPEITGVDVDPASGPTPYTNVGLVCTPSGWSDLDGDQPTDPNAGYTYAWTKQVGGSGGFVSVGGTSSTLDSTNFAQEDVVRCTVTPFDETSNEGSDQYGEATIGNRLPTITSASLTPPTAYTDTDLTCAGVGWSDADDDSEDYLYAWTKQVGGAGPQLGVGDGSDTLLADEFAQEDLIRCTVTPDDGFATGTSKLASKTITNRVPSITSATITPATAYNESTLTCTANGFSDGDADPDYYTFDWTKQVGGIGVPVSVRSVVSATNTDDLAASQFAQKDAIECTVTPNDGFDDGTAKNATKTITNRIPSITSATITPATAYTTNTLTCTAGGFSDGDSDPDYYTYDWTKQIGGTGIPVSVRSVYSGSNTDTLSSSNFVQTDSLVCTVTPHDGFDYGTAIPSSAKVITNRAPTAPTVSITSLPEAGTNALVCTRTAAATDADGDSITYTWEWTLDGAAWGGAQTDTSTNSTIATGDIQGCDQWTCQAVAGDGYDQTASASKSTYVNSAFHTENETADTMALPGHSADYTNFPIGYWFSAPTDFTIVGVRIPTTTSTAVQTVEIVKFGAQPTGSYEAGYEELACVRGVAGTTQVIELDPIDIAAGEYIGVVGARGTTTPESTRYSGSTYQTSIAGQGTVANTLLSWTNLYLTAPTTFYTVGTYFGRIELFYESHETCPQAIGQPDLVGNLSAYGACWYMGIGGATCDEVCDAVGGENLAEMVEDRWADGCGTPSADDVSTMFFNRGNYGAWSGPRSGSSPYHTLGYGYPDTFYYAKCASGTSTDAGAYPGETNSSGTRNALCACHRRQTFGPEHTFQGLTSEWFVRVGVCSPTGSLATDAAWFCQSLYGPNCTARAGYAAGTSPTDEPVLLSGAVSCTAGSPIPGTWCDGLLCEIWDTPYTTYTAMNNLTCDCY